MSKLFTLLSAAALILVSPIAFADGNVATIHCDDGDSLAAALDKPGYRLTLEFDGTCVENLDIRRSNLTIRGLDGSAIVQGAVRVAHADPSDGSAPRLGYQVPGPVGLENFTIQFSGGNGLSVAAGKVVTARNLTTVQNTLNGIAVTGGGWLRCIDCTSTNNGQDGIIVLTNGSVEIAGISDFSNNSQAGISVGNSGAASLFSHETGAPPVANISANGNAQDGIQVFDGGSILSVDYTNITANGNGTGGFGSGILVGTGSSGLLSGQITTNGNDAGVFSVAGKALFFGNVSASNNTFGLFALNNGTLRLTGASNDLNSNVQGFRIDGSFLQLVNTTFSANTFDGALVFGAKARLVNAPAASMLCDGTQLLSGAVCP